MTCMNGKIYLICYSILCYNRKRCYQSIYTFEELFKTQTGHAFENLIFLFRHKCTDDVLRKDRFSADVGVHGNTPTDPKIVLLCYDHRSV